MTYHPTYTLAGIVLATLAGCSSLPPEKSALELARIDYQAARDNPQTVRLAASELQDADAAMQRANQSYAKNEDAATVDHLAYLTRQRVAIAEEAAKQKAAEQRVADANAVRDRMQLEARTREADAARQRALVAQDQTRESELRNRQLEEQIKELNAKATPRGIVVTFGDVLFDTGRSTLKTGSSRNIEKLVNFLTLYPQRNVLIEGFTDSTGSEATNQALSERRSEAVRMALINLGVSPGRISTRGYGEAYPVAGNDSASGRQLNRRVEIVLSDDSGQIPPR
jgi:outer membrane protein OmpA-like peptidoglycan-associated protein